MNETKAKVLLVDDQTVVRGVLRAYLETVLQCSVSEAANGLEAVKLLVSADFDLIITDLVMPEMTGLELIGYLKKDPRLNRIPVVMLTSQEEEADRRKAAAFGVSEYLVKPFNPVSMRAVLARCLRLNP
ncbi:MAG: response regulator [Elusimicrobiales bacterium]|nr:response regulator [Elusimicrobiales bacterium]